MKCVAAKYKITGKIAGKRLMRTVWDPLLAVVLQTGLNYVKSTIDKAEHLSEESNSIQPF